MITLKKEPLLDDITIEYLVQYDTKANIQECLKMIGVSVPKHYKKEILIQIINDFYKNDIGKFVNSVSRDEWEYFSELLSIKQNEYVSVPRNDKKFLTLQKLFLVITAVDGDEWHLYMPDNIRQQINAMVKRDVQQHPALKEISKTANRLMAISQYVSETVLSKDPDEINAFEAKQLLKIVREKAKEMEEGREELVKIKSKYKNYDANLTELIIIIDDNLTTLSLVETLLISKL